MSIVLASGSWLRKTILEKSEFEFEVITKEVDERAIESANHDKTDYDIAVAIAEAKVAAVAADRPNDFIIAADSFAVLPSGERLHKPQDEDDAVRLSLLQAGKTIKAITGMAIYYKGQIKTTVSETKISYVAFTKDTIIRLLQDDDATIRNSGLGFFIDAPGFTLVESFEGSYTGAMGLPMEQVRKIMRDVGYRAD